MKRMRECVLTAMAKGRPSDVSITLACMYMSKRRSMKPTLVKCHGPLRLKQDIDFCFFALELIAYVIHIFQKADIGLDKLEFASAIEMCALPDYAIGRLLRPADKVHSWNEGILDECFECVFTNTTGPSNKDSHETWREGRGDTLVGCDGFR